MSIEKRDDTKVYNSEEEYFTKKIISEIKERTINKSFMEQIDLLIASIISLIENEYPIYDTLISKLGANQNFRFYMILYCINRLAYEMNSKFQKDTKDADSVIR